MGYRIGSFNLKNIGLTALGQENPRKLDMIAKIIKQENFDVVALQEVLSEGKAFISEDYAKKSILMELGSDWGFEWADAETQLGDPRGECYAFVWNKNRLRLPEVKTSSGIKRTFKPRICRINKEDMQRRPYYARFTPAGTGGPSFEIRLLCIHTYFGKDSSEHRKTRRHELDVLINDIYPQIADRCYGLYGSGMPSYTILLGDYNVELWRSWKENALKEINAKRRLDGKYAYRKPAFLKDNDDSDLIETTKWGHRWIRTVQYEATTLRGTTDNPDIFDSNGYIHDYDHFSFEESMFEGINMRVKRIDAVNKYYKGREDRFKSYFEEVSDHIPILMDIDLRSDGKEED